MTPWKLNNGSRRDHQKGVGSCGLEVQDANGRVILADYVHEETANGDQFARIVACVNAMDGIDNPALLRECLLRLAQAWRGDSTERVAETQTALVGIALALQKAGA